MYPEILRRLGYYCTNWTKTDYNLRAPKGLWNDSSGKAHWKNRKPGQPFFAIFNFTVCHESRIRTRPHKLVHDPKKVPIPAYHPDTQEVRLDWAQYHDKISEMDRQIARILQELEEAGLLENTIIFFYSDHGSGMPRNKRTACNSGLHVPFMVHVPERWNHLAPTGYMPGGRTERLVSFVDLAPTVVSIAGVEPPEYYQGKAFMGKFEAPPREYLFGFRGRMDERNDMVRSVRDERYVYVRNYLPHKPHGQHVNYQFSTPTTRIWKEMFDAGKLNEAQSYFWQAPRAPEELYDLKNDPDEVNNLADSPEHQEILEKFRNVHKNHVFEIRDVGFMPEPMIHHRSKGLAPYEVGHDPKKYPLEEIFPMADLASRYQKDALPQLAKGLDHDDAAVRYWAAMGLLMRGEKAVHKNRKDLHGLLSDKSPSVRLAAAEALGMHGNDQDVKDALSVLTQLGDPATGDVHTVVMALNVLDAMGDKAAPALPTIRTWPNNMKRSNDPRANIGVRVLVPRLKAQLSKAN